jgi:hypothetical protein
VIGKLEEIFIKTLFFLEEILSSEVFQIGFKMNSKLCARIEWQELLLLQIDITLHGKVVKIFVLSHHLKVIGLLRKNIKKMDLRSSIENAFDKYNSQNKSYWKVRIHKDCIFINLL